LRKTAIAIGILFWISNVATILGSVITGPIQAGTDSLTSMFPHASQWVVGTLVTHVSDAAIVLYAVLLFAVLKNVNEGLALGYVAFKALEAVMLMVAAIAALSLIPLSQNYLAAGTTDATTFKAAADLALGQYDWAGRLAALAYVVATPILNFLLFRSRIVPRCISIWGFVAVGLLALGLALGAASPTKGFQIGQLLVIPILFWEVVFATWLIVKGFRSSSAATQQVTTKPASSLVATSN
jgi:hypothetical protein